MPGEPEKTPPRTPLECEWCQDPFEPKRAWKVPPRFCSDRCRAAWHVNRRRSMVRRANELLSELRGLLIELGRGDRGGAA